MAPPAWPLPLDDPGVARPMPRFPGVDLSSSELEPISPIGPETPPMLLNRVEYLMMNNPVRGAIQRFVEAPRLRRLGGPLPGGHALEIGCGRGVGARLILEQFGAARVDGFDLDPRMVRLARRRLTGRGSRARLWVGDAAAIAAPDAAYDAVFDFGIIHHVPDWRRVLAEVRRVLKPGGRFYAEEMLARFLGHPLTRWLTRHPTEDRFSAAQFVAAMESHGLAPVAAREIGPWFAWFVADRPATPP
jgi:ubiquinone/menaquinone biosynthesis C-methylase UbiE